MRITVELSRRETFGKSWNSNQLIELCLSAKSSIILPVVWLRVVPLERYAKKKREKKRGHFFLVVFFSHHARRLSEIGITCSLTRRCHLSRILSIGTTASLVIKLQAQDCCLLTDLFKHLLLLFHKAFNGFESHECNHQTNWDILLTKSMTQRNGTVDSCAFMFAPWCSL